MQEIQSLVCFLYLLIKSAEKVNTLHTRQNCRHLAYKMGLRECFTVFVIFTFFFLNLFLCMYVLCIGVDA